MAIKKIHEGFALLIAIIFMSVMLTFGLTLSSVAYKQEILSSTAIQAQYAFYAADAGLECLLYADQQLGLFPYTDPASSVPAISCTGKVALSATQLDWSNGFHARLVVTERLDMGERCADVTIYKYRDPYPLSASTNITTILYSQGYNVPCASLAATGRVVSRGIKAEY